LDVVGGELLGEILKQIKPEGSVAICGLVGSPKLDITVFPFILRGVNLLGINSAEIPDNLRKMIWHYQMNGRLNLMILLRNTLLKICQSLLTICLKEKVLEELL